MPRILCPVRLTEIAGLLGSAASSLAGLAALRLDAVRKRTREQLLEVARRLELTGVSKLKRDELAARVLDGLRELNRGKKAEAASPRRPKAKPARPAPAGKVAKAGAEPAPRAPASKKPAPARAAPARKKAPPRVKAAPSPVAEVAAARSGEDPSATAKLDLGPAGRAEKPVEHIPWSYDHDRVTAAAVDPDRLFVYWEVTDEAVEGARAGLGPGGPGAWLNLRVYDTTGIIFDGTNAHGYFDQRVEHSDRQWFFAVGKPTSTAHVDIGMRSTEGFFVRIARSGRVEFPRKDPTPWSEPEWLTVLPSTGEVRHAGTGAPARSAAGGPPVRGEPPPPFAPIALWRLHESGADREVRISELLEAGWERVEWQETGGEGWTEVEARLEWQGPVTTSTWEAGPFSYPVDVEPPSRQEWKGPSFAFKVAGVTHVVYGPWQVVIRNLGARQERAVLGRWEMYRSWVSEGGREVAGAVRSGAAVALGASERMGASERRWLSGSELRLGGASEIWRLGASELRLRGASEILFAGASQWLLAGASERRAMGASERRLGGASERVLGGASERLGGSERRLGGSEERVGGSEERPGGEQPGSYPKVEE